MNRILYALTALASVLLALLLVALDPPALPYHEDKEDTP